MKPYLLKGTRPLPKAPEPDPVRVGLSSVENGVGDLKERVSVIPGGIAEVLVILREMQENERKEKEEESITDAKEKAEEERHEAEEAKAIRDQINAIQSGFQQEQSNIRASLDEVRAMVAETIDVTKILLAAVEDRVAGMLAQHKPRDDRKIIDAIESLGASVDRLLNAPKFEFDLTPIRGTDGRIVNVKAVQK
jgi:hypothetical protein